MLAIGCIVLFSALIWSMRHCRSELAAMAKAHAAELKAIGEAHEKYVKDLIDSWGKRIDQFRLDVKEAFGENTDIADKMVEAMTAVKLELARMSGRRERD